MHPLDRVLEALADHGCTARRSGDGYAARCPHHEDHRPSLKVSMGEKAVVMHCHTGCSTEDIVADLGLAMSDLFLEGQDTLDALLVPLSYDYRDADGRLLYQVVRRPGKRFVQRRPVGDDWEWNLKGVTPLLYHLQRVLDEISLGSTIYVAEGEKDVDALYAAGAVATCNSGGAGKWRPEFGAILSNAEHVVIVADDDEPGFAHAETVAASLNGASYEIVVARVGKDASDHLAAGYGVSDFVPRRDPPPEHQAVNDPKPTTDMRVRYGDGFRMRPVRWFPGFEGFIPIGMLSMLAGLPGLGKSMFGTYLACAASARGEKVLIAAAEDSIEHTLLARLVAGGANVAMVGFADIPGGSIHLPDHEHLLRKAVAEHQPRLLILDPIGSFMGRSIDVWKDTDVRGALDPLKLIAEDHDLALLMVAHLNKGTGSYLSRLANSAAFGQVVRSGMLWSRDPDDPEGEDGDRRILVSGKLNVAMRPPGHVYRISPTSVVDEDGQSYGTARLHFVEEARRETDELLTQRAPQGRPSPETEEAMALLSDALADGPLTRKQVAALAKEAGLSMTPIYKAVERLGVVQDRLGFQKGTAWRLP